MGWLADNDAQAPSPVARTGSPVLGNVGFSPAGSAPSAPAPHQGWGLGRVLSDIGHIGVNAGRAIARPSTDLVTFQGGKAMHDTAQLVSDVTGGTVNQFAKGVVNVPLAIAREVQNKPITDIQKNTFGTTDPTQIAKKIAASTVGTASLFVGGGEAGGIRGAASASRAALVKSSLKLGAAGATGNASATINQNPNATAKQIAKSAVIGGVTGASIPGASSLLGKAISRAQAARGAGVIAPKSALDAHIAQAETKSPVYTSKTKGDIPVDTMSPTHAKNALAGVQKSGNADPALVKALTERAALTPPKIPVEPAKVGSAVKTFGSKMTVLNKIGTPSSTKLAGLMRQADLTTAKLRTNFTNKAPTFRSLGDDDLQTAWQVAEGKLKSSDPVINKAAKEARSVMDSVEKARITSGREAGHIPNYMPREYDWKAIKKDSVKYNSALNSMVKSGAATDLTDAAKKFSYLSKPGNLQKTSFSHFDLQRGIDMPGYKMNRDVFDRYLSGASQDIANSTHFGPNNKVTNKLLGGVVKEGGDAGLAKEAVQNYLHAPETNSLSGKALGGTRAVFGTTRLGKAAIAHAGQTSNVLLSTRTSDFGAGWIKRFGSEGKNFIDKSGVNHPSVIHGYQDQYTGLTGKLSRATAPLLRIMMQVNRGVAALAGRRYGNFLAAKGDAASLDELKQLGVSGKIGKTLTKNQEFEAARGMADKTMFNPSRSTTPIKAETSIGKTIGQYRTAYVYKQTGLLYNQVLKQAAAGNLKPLAKFIAISSPVGYGITEAKSLISGRKQGPGGTAIDTAGMLGGLPGEIAVQMARYAKGNIEKTVAGTVAPMAGEAVDVAQRTQDLIKDKYGKSNPKPLEQYGAGLVPIVGSRLGKALNPPTATAQTLNANPDIQKSLKGLNYSVVSPNQKQRGVQLSPQQYKDFVNQSNAIFVQKAKSALADPNYKSLSATQQKSTMSAQLSAARKQVLDQIIGANKRSSTPRFKPTKY